MVETKLGSDKPTAKVVKSDTISHLWAMVGRDAREGVEYAKDVKPTITMGWLMFKEKVTMEALQKEIREKLISKIHRYHAVPVEKEGWMCWQDIGIENLDMEYHFMHHKGFEQEQDWQAFLEKSVTTPLDYTKPQWKYILVDKMPNGLCAVIGIADHAMADGASGVASLLSMAESAGDNPVFQKKSERAEESGPKARKLTAYEKFCAFTSALLLPVTDAAIQDMDSRLKQPTDKFANKWHFATTPAGEGLDLEKFKEIKNAVPGSTVNDVMLAITALSIREYYKSIGDPIMSTTRDIHGSMAVNNRPAGADYLADNMYGNKIVVATTRYPLHESRVNTLLSMRDASRIRRSSPDTNVRQMLLNLSAKIPKEKLVPIMQATSLKASIMISNVLFSTNKLRLFGQDLEDVRFIACTGLGYYCGAATYNGKVTFGCVTTEEVQTSPEKLMPFISAEFGKLYQEVMYLKKIDPDYFIKQDKPLPVSMLHKAMFGLLLALAFYYALF